jgi:sucrose-6F-phosphate phosphohydrolase
MSRLLLCTDLDRTLLPNGRAPESAGAREAFARLVSHAEVQLVFVTGRDPGLAAEAIATWELPEPDLLIANVGTTIVSPAGERWEKWIRWDEAIAGDWSGHSTKDLSGLLGGLPGLDLQDASRQAAFKLSYFTPSGPDGQALAQATRERLAQAGIKANVIWSVDESNGLGLLDILPASATKRQAIEFVMAEWNFRLDEVVFAGDSGNDLDVLVSPIPAVLVANASSELREVVMERAEAQKWDSSLYCARGGVLGMNGNYAAGILEGVLHFHPDWGEVLKEGT